MHLEETAFADLKIISLDKYTDERGYFIERFQEKKFHDLGISYQFVQDNHSKSNPNVLRGLHMQTEPAQAKLVGCLEGAIFDVAVDMRPTSKTYGQSFSIILSEENAKLLWIPEGFAHGFYVLGEKPAHVCYKTTAFYNAKAECGIIWNDPTLAITWPNASPILSPKDLLWPTFKDVHGRL